MSMSEGQSARVAQERAVAKLVRAVHARPMKRLSGLIVAALAFSLTAGAYVADAKVPAQYKNCTAVNKKYPHGIGKLKARDKTSGTPVTTFKRSTKLYNIVAGANGGLDRDGDGIACEKA